jgi:Tfp pilus assembly protein PilZ
LGYIYAGEREVDGMISDSILLKCNTDQFFKVYLQDLPGGGLFIETNKYYGLGDSLEIHLDLEGLSDVVTIRGGVAWHRRPRAWQSVLPSGIGFEFAPEHRDLKEFLLEFCSGKVGERRKVGPRTTTEFPVKLLVDGSWSSAKAQNICDGGLFILTDERVVVGATVQMKLFMDNLSTPADCQSKLVWRSDNREIKGFGAQFKSMDHTLKKHLSTIPPSTFDPRETSRLSKKARSTLVYNNK